MQKNEERLAKNRKRLRIRNEQKRIFYEAKIRNAKELMSLNINLRKKNLYLIRELRRNGIVLGEGVAHPTNQTNLPYIPFSMVLLDTRQQQSPLTQKYNTRTETGVGLNVYSQPPQNAMVQPTFQHSGILSNSLKQQQRYALQEKSEICYQPSQNTIAPTIRPTSLYGGMSYNTSSLGQAMGNNLDQQLRHALQKETATSSILFEPIQHPLSLSSTHTVHNINVSIF